MLRGRFFDDYSLWCGFGLLDTMTNTRYVGLGYFVLIIEKLLTHANICLQLALHIQVSLQEYGMFYNNPATKFFGRRTIGYIYQCFPAVY